MVLLLLTSRDRARCYDSETTLEMIRREPSIQSVELLFRISSADWCWIVLAISTVWAAEALNTTFEFLADAASPEFHPLVRDAKDVAVGPVLLTVAGAVRPAQRPHLGKSEMFDQAAKFRKSSARFPADRSGKTCRHMLQPLARLE